MPGVPTGAAATIDRVCDAPIVREALDARRRLGYLVLSREIVSGGFPSDLGALVIRFACPPGKIELPWPAMRAIFYRDTGDVFSLADPYVAGQSVTIPEPPAVEYFEGALPFVLAVPAPRSHPIHENQLADAAADERRWAAARGIDLSSR